MSDQTYDRAINRELGIWTPFTYSFLFTLDQVKDRAIIFGLYSSMYKNKYEFTRQIEAEELLILLTDYNYLIANISNQEQITLNEIISRRYIENVNKLIHDQKMITYQQKLDTESAKVDAKIAALAADQLAVENMALKVEMETKKITAKIQELEAYIQLEGYNLEQVNLDIAEAEVKSAKFDLAKLNAANDILKIQLDTILSAAKLVDVDVQIAKTNLEKAQTNARIESMELLKDQVVLEKNKTLLSENEVTASYNQIELISKANEDINAELAYQSVLSNEASTENINKLALDLAQQEFTKYKLDQNRLSRLLQLELNESELNLDPSLLANERSTQEAIDEQSRLNNARKIFNKKMMKYTVLDIAEMLATANILTTLTHSIGVANE